jgi:outer membrane protein OmpA-like peptidoglycan-associated protein
VKARFPGRQVADEAQVAPGAPDGWQQCVVAGLAALPRLKTGKSLLTDLKLSVTGATDDYAASQSVPNDVKAAAGQTCDATTSIAFTGQMKSELSWKATRDQNGMVTIDGEAPDEPSKQQLADMAQDLYAGSSVTDTTKVVGASAEPWMSITRLGIGQLAKLKRGEVALQGKEVSIKGAVDSEDAANQVRRALKDGVPGGYTVKDALTVMSADEKAADSCQTLMRQTTARGTINFERAKADLTPDSTATLKALADVANKCPAYKIDIEGHTDAEGTDERNQRLSDRRAQAVADFLAESGVDAKRMKTVGYGATKPIADNATADGRAKNRRIEFTVRVN